MDPVGPWSAYAASYNRLTGAPGGFQASPASGGGDFVASHHHLATTANTGLGSHQPPGSGVPSTTSQLLLQAAHTNATLAGQLGQLSAAAPGSTPSPFSPGGFLTPPSVGYDSVFSPLFHHANPKPAHYGTSLNVSQHRQALAQAQAVVNKSNAVESELSSLRENYSNAHPSIAAVAAAVTGNSFFDQASSSSSLPWSHQGNSQLPSPFGVLPHETVVTSSPGSASTKSSSSAYENTFNAHFVAAQSLNHLNSHLAAPSDFNKSTNNYVENVSKKAKSQTSHVAPVKTIGSSSPASVGTFYNQTSSAYSGSVSSRNCAPLTGNFNNKSQHSTGGEYTPNTKSYTSTTSLPQQQSCIVSTTQSSSLSSVSTKDYRNPQPSSRTSNSVFLSNAPASSRPPQPTGKLSSRTQNFISPSSKASVHHGVQTKAQTKVYPELGSAEHAPRGDSAHESSQSSPISFAMIDATSQRQGLNYSSAQNTNSCGSGSNSSKIPTNRNSSSNVQLAHPFQHALTSQTPAVTAAGTGTSYSSRHYSGLTVSESTNDYHHGNRNVKSSSAADSSFSERLINSSNASSQNSPDCGVVPRRPSPLQAHSQASPLSHVPSPGYPLYNSPIASMSSPSPLQHHSEATGSNGNARQHNGNPSSQQVTPASPLDVSIPRPSSQSSQVAYSSVITRALTSGDGSSKSFSTDTNTQRHHQEFSHKQNCWDSSERSVPNSRTAGKFSGSNTSYSTPSNASSDESQVISQNNSGSQARSASNITDRSSAYFDSNPVQVTLQDLSNCRGDPMTIVKNLQSLQPPCQLPQSSQQLKSDERAASVNSTATSAPEDSSVNENSNCAARNVPDEHPKVIVPNIEEELGFLSEVGEPPVTSAVNSQVSTSSKSVCSVSVDPTITKMPEKKPFTYSNPASGNGFMESYLKFLQGKRETSPPQNRRGSKSSWPKTKAYQSSKIQNTSDCFVKIDSIDAVSLSSNTPSVSNTSVVDTKSTESQLANTSVVDTKSTESQLVSCKSNEMPNYDPQDDPRYFPLKKERNGNFTDSDEDFVTEDNGSAKQKSVEENEFKECDKKSDTNKDPSKDENKDEKSKSAMKSSPKLSSCPDTKANVKPSSSKTVTLTTHSSDKTLLKPISKTVVTHQAKPIPSLPDDILAKSIVKIDKSAILEKGKKHSSSKSRAGSKKKWEIEEDIPRRELSRRAAKEKTLTNINQQVLLEEEFDVDEPEFMDSDSDPAWTPAKDSSDDDVSNRRRTRRTVGLLNSRKRARFASPGMIEDEGRSSSESQDGLSLDRPNRQNKQKICNKGKGRPLRTSVTNTVTVSPLQKATPSPAAIISSESTLVTGPGIGASGSSAEKEESSGTLNHKESPDSEPKTEESMEFPFKSGEFVVMKSDLKEENPPIWRIDGKTLLQKYEPFQENGKTLYRNISTYSGWTTQNKHVYQQVPVKFKVQNRMETIVEFLQDELYTDDDIFEKSMKETAKHQDNFEVYIQTLISQALDSNFLPEILQEGDEYFLASVKKVDNITDERKQRLLEVTKWKPSVVTSVGTWPCFNIISDLPVDEKAGKLCAACQKCTVSVRVQMYGQPYNKTTLEGCPPKFACEKDFLLCKTCLTRVELFHKVAHQKYLMFIECSKKVAEKRNYNDTTVILNELLANESWLNELFLSVRKLWAEIDKLARQLEKSGK